MAAKKSAAQQRQGRAVGDLKAVVKNGRGSSFKQVRTAVLSALKADCSDAEIGRAMRLAALAEANVS